MKAKTWRELRELVNALPEDQLDKPIHWWSETGNGFADVNTLKEDQFVDEENEIWPRSCVEEDLAEGATAYYAKGMPIINVQDKEETK